MLRRRAAPVLPTAQRPSRSGAPWTSLSWLLLLLGCVAPGCSSEPGSAVGSGGSVDVGVAEGEGEGGGVEGEGEGSEGEGEGGGVEGEGEGSEGEGEGEGGSCTPLDREPASSPTRVRCEADGEFFASPFPDDTRLDIAGRPVLDGFPNPGNSNLLTQLCGVISAQTPGWSSNGAIYVPLLGGLHPASLPADPAATLAPGSPVYLAELDAQGHLGARLPLMLRYQREPTLFLPADTLIAYPVPGFVPQGGRRHALVLTTGLLDRSCRPLAEADGALRTRLLDAGLDPTGVAGAAIFTPQDVIGPMRKLAAAVQALPPPAAADLAFDGHRGLVDIYTGVLPLPNFQAGNPPYLAVGSGGNIVWSDAGEPLVQRFESVRFSLAIPTGHGPMPAQGWPVLIYSHGTGGDYETVLYEGVAAQLASRGIASVGFDQVLHGTRDPSGTDPALTFFNVFNMAAGRDNVRQGGVDGLWFRRFVRQLVLPAAEAHDGAEVRFDDGRVLFMGHSQGGITGAPFVAVSGDLRAAVFSGSSGLMSITILERADLEFEMVPGVTTYKALVEQLLGIQGREELDMFSPALTLLQTFIEAADPASYAPYWHRLRPDGEAGVPLLILEGFLDEMAPAIGAEALAVAAGADLVRPLGRPVAGLELLGRAPLAPPVQGNWDGVTAGLSQYPFNGHFALFDNALAKERVYEFLLSALQDEQPIIE